VNFGVKKERKERREREREREREFEASIGMSQSDKMGEIMQNIKKVFLFKFV